MCLEAEALAFFFLSRQFNNQNNQNKSLRDIALPRVLIYVLNIFRFHSSSATFYSILTAAAHNVKEHIIAQLTNHCKLPIAYVANTNIGIPQYQLIHYHLVISRTIIFYHTYK